MTKPATARRSCPMPASRRPAMSEPKPGGGALIEQRGVPGGGPAKRSARRAQKDAFIRIHHSAKYDGETEKNSDAAGHKAGDVDQSAYHHEAEDQPPMLAHHSAARAHRRPKLHLLVNDQRQGEHPTDTQIDGRNHRDDEAQQRHQKRPRLHGMMADHHKDRDPHDGQPGESR